MFTELLRAIACITPPLHVMGGIAEELILFGTMGQGHRDLDLLIPVERLGMAADELIAIGLEWKPEEIQPGHPYVFLTRTLIPVEVWPCLTGPSGDSFAIVPGMNEQLYRLTLPDDTFDFPACQFGSLRLHTISPQALYWMRSTSAMTRHEGSQREQDQKRAAEIRAAFYSTLSVEELTFPLEEL